MESNAATANDNPDNVPALIVAWRAGDDVARDRIVSLLIPAIRAFSERELRRLVQPVSLHPSDLAQESVIEFIKRGAASTDAVHLRALAAGIVRTTLIDYLRVRNADRRGKRDTENVSITVLNNLGSGAMAQLDLVAVHNAMQALEQISPRVVRIVEMRVFGGLTEREVAEVLGVSRPTVTRDWLTAKLWLARELSDAVTQTTTEAHARKT